MTDSHRKKIIEKYDALYSPQEESELYVSLIWIVLPLILELKDQDYYGRIKDEQGDILTEVIDLTLDLQTMMMLCMDEQSVDSFLKSPLGEIFIPFTEKDKKAFATKLFMVVKPFLA